MPLLRTTNAMTSRHEYEASTGDHRRSGEPPVKLSPLSTLSSREGSVVVFIHALSRVFIMTLVASHSLPAGSLPLSAMKEELSMAYVHMLASATGLDIGTWGQDYDCRDVTLQSSVEYPDLVDASIDLQLKCTGQETVQRKNSIAWSLDKRSVAKMTRTHRATPYLFCVLVAPADPEVWLTHNADGLLARSHMYWLWGHQLPAPIPTQQHQTVHVPRVNVLTPASLLELMEEASRWRPRK